MRKIWIHKDVEAQAEVVWELLTDLDLWSLWGPSVRRAELDGGRFERGATGTVTSALGPRLRFEITTYVAGVHWGWKVGGLDATDHRVEERVNGGCRVSFGVPCTVAPYFAVVRYALHRIKALAESADFDV